MNIALILRSVLLHSALGVAQREAYGGCPSQRYVGREQTLRARAVICSCVRKVQDKGCRDRLRPVQERWKEAVGCVCECVCVAKERPGLSRIFHFISFFIRWGSELFDVVWMTPVLRCDAACQWWDGGQRDAVRSFPASAFLWYKEQKLCFRRETESN